MHDTLPKPEKRRAFKPGDVLRKYAAQRGLCAKCHCDLVRSGYERDHIVRHDALGKTDYNNLQLLCPPCHAIKSRDDNREAKKGRRIRGENKPRVTKPIPSRGFPKLAEGRDPKRWQSAGFNKSLRRKFNGKVERVEP